MKKGFTLIELIVVIAIIAILAAIIAPNAFKAIEKAKISQTVGDFKTLKNAWIALFADIGRFPADSFYGMNNPLISDTHLLTNAIVLAGWDGPYIEKDPIFPWGAGYRYDYDSDCHSVASPNAGINILWDNNDASMESTKLTDISEKIDAILDGDDDNINGTFRLYQTRYLMYLIADGC